MWRRIVPAVLFFLGTVGLAPGTYPPAPGTGQGPAKAGIIRWQKTVIDPAFRSEGVAVADINKDGKMDIIVGDVWYQAPNWKRHLIRKDRTFNPLAYSQTFGCFTDDINGDGWVDLVPVPFPGAPCAWYENPGREGGPWKEHILSHSACNETPLYADLFGTGKRVLIMGVQPKGQENMGQMFWIRPGKDPTQLWEHHPISEPSKPGQVIPGTHRFSHGLGVGDLNGDGRRDVLCTGGWWEQPARDQGEPWKFHPTDLGPACADMYVCDLDGDGKNDVLSSSAHAFGLWWHQHKAGKESPVFVRHEMFLGLGPVANRKNHLLTAGEKTFLDLVNLFRANKNLPPVKPVASLCQLARTLDDSQGLKDLQGPAQGYKGEVHSLSATIPEKARLETFFKELAGKHEKLLLGNWREVGLAQKGSTLFLVLGKGKSPLGKSMVVWEGMKKQFFSQTHALHFVDINGDGIKDLVTGRRWWAHGPKGDPGSTEPAYLFWLEGRRSPDGIVTFLPHLVDDDSGIGTQFAVQDVDGDGFPDIIISNKKGVFLFGQRRIFPVEAAPERKDTDHE